MAAVGTMRRQWDALRPHIDAERWQLTGSNLAVQEREARWWRDASIAYFRSVSGRPLPPDVVEPEHDRAWYKAQSFPHAPGQGR